MPRAGIVLVLGFLLALGGCSDCVEPDVDAAVAQWNAKLAGQPPGADVPTVEAFLATRGIAVTREPERRRLVGSVASVAAVDSRKQCNLVSWQVEIECRFGVDGRLQSCRAQSVGTGP